MLISCHFLLIVDFARRPHGTFQFAVFPHHCLILIIVIRCHLGSEWPTVNHALHILDEQHDRADVEMNEGG